MSHFRDNPFPWFAIQTHLRKEKVAAAQLEVRGYEVYLPQYRKKTRWSDRHIEVECPLFPGYLFCRFDSSLPSIVTISSVVSIIGKGKQPEPISEREIANVKTVVQSGSVDPFPYLRVGDNVIIVQGPLRGVEGLLVASKRNLKLIVSVDLLQRSVAAEIDAEAVRKVPQNG